MENYVGKSQSPSPEVRAKKDKDETEETANVLIGGM